MAKDKPAKYWQFKLDTRRKFTELSQEIARINSGGGADIDLTDYATKVWVEAKGYITASALTPYALKTDIPSLVGYATEDFVNNKLGDYATQDYVATKLVDYAPLTSVQGFENRIGGLEGAVPQLNERVTTVEGKVSSLNETVSTGENNLLDRVNVIEEEYATKTYVDNAIDGIDLSSYLKTEDAEETYATKASVEQLAAAKLDSSYFTLTNIKSTLGISDWALAATKPSYAWSEITSRPTALSQFTDDVVAGKYLPLSGGTLSNAAWRSQLTIERSGSANDSVIAFSNSNGLLGCLGYRGADGIPCVWLGETGTGIPIIHANNIGSYNAGSADSANKLNAEYLADLNNGTRGRLFYSAFQAANTPSGANYFAGLTFGNDSINQIAMSYNGNLYTRYYARYSNIPMWSNWKKVAFTDSNVASATKLQTPRKLWGQSFDGTGDVSGTFRQLYTGSYDGAVAHSILCDINGPYGLITRINGNGDVLQQAQRETTEVEWFNFILQPLGGNVGIGNTSPTERLDVSGNIKASGNINATSITINGVTITASNGSITVNGNVFATGDITGFV